MFFILPAFGGNRKGLFLTSRDGWNDADLVSVFHGCRIFLKESDVLIIKKDIHESADRSVFVIDTLTDAGVGDIQVFENVADGFSLGGNNFLFGGEFAEWGWDTYGCHDRDFIGLLVF